MSESRLARARFPKGFGAAKTLQLIAPEYLVFIPVLRRSSHQRKGTAPYLHRRILLLILVRVEIKLQGKLGILEASSRGKVDGRFII